MFTRPRGDEEAMVLQFCFESGRNRAQLFLLTRLTWKIYLVTLRALRAAGASRTYRRAYPFSDRAQRIRCALTAAHDVKRVFARGV